MSRGVGPLAMANFAMLSPSLTVETITCRQELPTGIQAHKMLALVQVKTQVPVGTCQEKSPQPQQTAHQAQLGHSEETHSWQLFEHSWKSQGGEKNWDRVSRFQGVVGAVGGSPTEDAEFVQLRRGS